MALPLLIRAQARGQGLPKSLRFPLLSQVCVKNFGQFTVQTRRNDLMLTSRKTNLINVLIPLKRNMSADHSKLWPIEKLVTLSLLVTVPASMLLTSSIVDNILAVATVAHVHWGLEACCADYVRPIIFGPVIPKLAIGLLYIISATTLGGLLYLNHSSIGIGGVFKKIWFLGRDQSECECED